MGYGGFFKSIVKIVAVVASQVAFPGNPLAAAIASAAATGATGGSFKEALIGAGTAYIGVSVSNVVGPALSEGGSLAQGASAAADPLSDAALFAAEGVTTGGVPTNLASDVISRIPGSESLADSLMNYDPSAAITQGASGVAPAVAGGWTTIDGVASNLSSFDVFNSVGSKTLGEYIGYGAGALSSMTIEQALLAGTPEAADALRQAGFTDSAIAALTQEARNSLAQKKFDELVLSTPNPLKDDEEFRKVIAAGIERINTGLGGKVTQSQWDATFGGNELGGQILDTEQTLRRQSFTDKTKQAFGTEPMFKPVDDRKLIDQILDEQQGPASNILANAQARGSVNPYGGRTANEELVRQRGEAETKLGTFRDAAVSDANQDIGAIQDEALAKAGQYKLGDELFSPDPYKTRATDLATQRQASLGQDIRSLLGQEPLFDPTGAINVAGKAQGQVGGGSPALLDAIAARADARNKSLRGLGNRGSGVF